MIEAACRERKPRSVGVARQCRRDAARAGAPRRQPDVVTDQTSAHDPINGYLPRGLDARRVGGAARERSERRRAHREGIDGGPRARDARLLAARRPDRRLRQQHPPDGEGDGRRRRLRFPGLRAGVYPPAVLPRRRPVPLGRAVRRSRGHLPHRRQGEGADAERPASAPLARHGAHAHPLPGPAGAHLLGRARRPAPPRARVQRDGGARASSRRRS